MKALLLLCIPFASCVTPVPDAWIAADRATYEAVAPELKAYVEADPNLGLDQKMLRTNMLDDWRLRLEAHEALVR